VTTKKPIIFYDGVCGMCNSFVSLMLRADRKHIFLFAPLQGPTAQELLPPLSNDARQWSMIYLDERGIHDQSDASLEVYRRLGGAWWVLSLFRFIPRFIRTPVYRFVARNRYKFFGKRDACRVVPPEQQSRFLP
jgi:predicted DCC family thiol-disulfide oxidoreductase YuxK